MFPNILGLHHSPAEGQGCGSWWVLPGSDLREKPDPYPTCKKKNGSDLQKKTDPDPDPTKF